MASRFPFAELSLAPVAGQPGEGKRAIWIVARQHPGESMAEWFMQVIPE